MRMSLSDRSRKLESRHIAEQINVRQDNVKLSTAFDQRGEVTRLDALDDRVATLSKVLCDGHPNENVGFEDQYTSLRLAHKSQWRVMGAPKILCYLPDVENCKNYTALPVDPSVP